MIRCIILDDEPLILRSIKTKIERLNNNFKVVGTASDGVAGLKIISELKPDVVFTDIRMPMMDGLEMSEKIHEIVPDTIIIILSGYKLFDYAQRAIQLNVEDYLVKPIDNKRLENLLEKLEAKTEQKRKSKYDGIITKAVRGTLTEEEREYWNQTAFAKKEAVLIAIKICKGSYLGYRFHQEEPLNETRNENSFEKILEEICSQDELFWVIKNGFTNEDIVICYTSRGRDKFISSFWNCTENVFAGKETITSVVSEPLRDIMLLKDIVPELENILYRYAVFAKTSCIYHDKTGEEKRVISSACKEELKGISEAVRIKNNEKILQKIHDVFEICEDENTTQVVVLKVVRNILRKILQEDNMDENVMADVLVFSSGSYPELEQNIKRMLNGTEWLEAIDQSFNLGTEAIVDKIIVFIKQSRDRKISIQDIAEQYHISHSYLCTIFKRYTDMTPSEYIIYEKMAYARKLLSSGREMSIGDISMAVGYEDPFYFSRLFKMHTGMTPSAYRKKNKVEVGKNEL